jgi:hypothetical protein
MKDKWLQLMAEACLLAESMSIAPQFSDTGKRLKKRTMFHDDIPSETNAYNR